MELLNSIKSSCAVGFEKCTDMSLLYVYICMCLCMFSRLLFPYRGGMARVLSSACKDDRADFTDWMSFLQSNVINEISPNTEALSANT